jgi:hypothetical protein
MNTVDVYNYLKRYNLIEDGKVNVQAARSANIHKFMKEVLLNYRCDSKR